MVQRGIIVSLLSLLTALAAYGGCGQNPMYSTFTVGRSCGDAGNPCVEGEPITLTVSANTGCYPWYAPCAPYTFDSCDVVEWNLGGTIVTGGSTITRTFGAGRHDILATVKNASGERLAGTGLFVAKKPLAFVRWSQPEYTVREGDGSITITLVRTGDTSRAVPMKFETQNGGRLAYLKQDIVMPAGVASLPITLQVNDDSVYTGEEQNFIFVYSESGDAVMSYMMTLSETRVRVIDDEPGPVATIDDVRVVEGTGGTKAVDIPIVLSQPLAKELTIFHHAIDGTATHDLDYRPDVSYGVLETTVIPAGQTRGAIRVHIIGDAQSEPDESLTLRLERFVHAPPVTLSQARVTVTIEDDDLYRLDAPPTATLTPGHAMTLTVGTSQPSATATSVAIDSSNAMVIRVPSQVTIPANASSATFTAEAIAPGVATITATFPNGQIAQTQLVASRPSTIAFERSSLRVSLGGKETVRISVTPSPLAPTGVIIRSQHGDFVTFRDVTIGTDGYGTLELTGVKLGKTTIGATLPAELGGGTSTIAVEVVPPASRRRAVR